MNEFKDNNNNLYSIGSFFYQYFDLKVKYIY